MSTSHPVDRPGRFERALERRLEDVIHRLTVLTQRSRPEEWDGGGDNTPFNEGVDASRAVEERDFEQRESARLVDEADDLRGALQRIRSGTYGRCVECDGAIAASRLVALPETRYCIACETRREAAPSGSASG